MRHTELETRDGQALHVGWVSEDGGWMVTIRHPYDHFSHTMVCCHPDAPVEVLPLTERGVAQDWADATVLRHPEPGPLMPFGRDLPGTLIPNQQTDADLPL